MRRDPVTNQLLVGEKRKMLLHIHEDHMWIESIEKLNDAQVEIMWAEYDSLGRFAEYER